MPYADKEKQKLYWREYQRRPKRVEYKKRWNVENKDWVAEQQRRRTAANPQKFRDYFRNRHILKTYGITTEQYEEMFRQQGGVCAICGAPPDVFRQGITRLVIDHDHATGKIRGLLCNNCNAGMGILGDTVKHLEQALAYLKRVG